MNNNNDDNNYTQTPDTSSQTPIVLKTVTDDESPYNKINNQDFGKKHKSRKSRGSMIALIICCSIVFSSIFGIGGGLIAYNYMSSNNSQASTPNAQTNNSVIKQAVESIDNQSTDNYDAIVNATAFAKDTVVEISTETVQTNMFYGQYITEGAGSGVIISDDGYTITCAHVIEGASTVTVVMTDGMKYDAKVIGQDKQTDIAVLKIESDNSFPSAIIGNSDNIVLGEATIAIGNPLGTLGGSVSNGIISALDREIKIDGQNYKLLQTNAAINPGNSGGGLFNIKGELIGIVNAKSSGNIIEGLGFAIPINDAVKIAEELMTNGYISGRPRLGVNVYEFNAESSYLTIRNSEFAALLNYIDEYGVYFLEYDGTQTGDLQFGDRIIAMNGTPVSSFADISSLLQDEFTVGDEIEITVVRKTIEGRSTTSKLEHVKLTLIESSPQEN